MMAVGLHATFDNGATVDLIATRPRHADLRCLRRLVVRILEVLLRCMPASRSSKNDFTSTSTTSIGAIPVRSMHRLTGNEDRDTFGGRVWGAFGGFKFDTDFAYQYGTFDTKTAQKTLSAFGTSSRLLYSFDAVPLQPGVQFQTSYFSGSDNPNSHTIGTFSAPFPRPTLLNYAGLETLENLFEAYPAFLINRCRN